QRLYQALPTLGDAKPDWWIIQEVANRLGANWNYSHPSDIFSEMASLSPLNLRPVTLEGKGLKEGLTELLDEFRKKQPIDIEWDIQ
ncbi:hypothetical protein LV454_29175, partial [Escherichia coli]|nr:hypothetical protein [Escherichia coli]